MKTIVLVIFAMLFFFYWSARTLHSIPLSKFVRGKIPILELRLRFINLKGEEVAPTSTPFAGHAQEGAMKKEGCSELIGGDTRNKTTLSADQAKRKINEDCPGTALWYVKRHPIAFSLHFEDGNKVLSLFETEEEMKALFKTKFIQGVFYNLLNSANVRAEDLRLDGIQGVFLSRFIKEALRAHAELHYDIVHGKNGFVFSFIRDECPFVAKALPLLAARVARSGYRVPGIEEPVLEMTIGLQRLFITQYKERVYLSNGLETLLNVIESLPPSSNDLTKMPLTLTVRTEAFLDKLPPALFDTQTFDARLGFSLSKKSLRNLRFPSGKYARSLRPKISKGVLASIPHDAFAALATSFQFPADMSDEDWQNLAVQGPPASPSDRPQEAGFALIWDFNSNGNKITDIGVVIANPAGSDQIEDFQKYFKNSELTGECGGGLIFLAATSQNLLSRMMESCEGRSLSILDWEHGLKGKNLDVAQILVFANMGIGIRELFLAGGARSDDLGEFEPRWKQEYEKAKEAMRQDGENVFHRVPILAYSGNVTSPVTPVELEGFMIKQGVTR